MKMRSKRRGGKTLVAAALGALMLAAPIPAAARVVVTVQVAYGSVVVGGVGFFLYIAGSWEIPFALRDVPTSLLEVSGDRVRLGVPLPAPRFDAAQAAGADDAGGVQLDLFRWRF